MTGDAAITSMADDRSDDDLLAALAAGDRGALAALMTRHLPDVLALAQRMTGNRDDADEVAQDAFVRVWRSAHRWRADGAARFSTWLYRVVVNLCIDRRRKGTMVPLEDAEVPVDPAPGGLDVLASRQGAVVVAEALADLPPRQRAAVCLYYYAGLSAPQAAQVLELSASAMESLLVRGRRALKKSLMGRGINQPGDLL